MAARAPALAERWPGPRLLRALAWRAPLVVLLITLARQPEWPRLRWCYSEAGFKMAEVMGYAPQRLGFDTVAWGGTAYQYTVPCTFINVAIGAAVLAWWGPDGAAANLRRAVALVAAILALNFVKGAAVDAALAAGVPHGPLQALVNGAAHTLIFVGLVAWLDRRTLAPQCDEPRAGM